MNNKNFPNIAEFIISPHHTALSVKNYEKAKEFFINVIGMNLESEWKNRKEKLLDQVVGLKNVEAHVAILELNGYRLELFEYLNPPGQSIEINQNDKGLTHICFQVNNVEQVYKTISSFGYKSLFRS